MRCCAGASGAASRGPRPTRCGNGEDVYGVRPGRRGVGEERKGRTLQFNKEVFGKSLWKTISTGREDVYGEERKTNGESPEKSLESHVW